MSYYSSENQSYQNDEEKPEELFRFNTSLIRSIQSLNEWKQSLSLNTIEYLHKEEQALSYEHDIFSCGLQARALAFTRVICRGFVQLNEMYKNAYAKILDPDYNLAKEINELDFKLITLSKYLQKIQANTLISLSLQLKEKEVPEIYSNLEKCIDYCFDLNAFWIAILTPKMFRQENKGSLYKTNYGGTIFFYKKQLSYLQDRIKKAEIDNFEVNPSSTSQLLFSIGLIVNSDKIKPNLKSKIISLLKGQHYAKMQKNLKQKFIVSSLQMYHGQETSEIWDYEQYEQLCIQTLKQSFTNFEYLDCMLYMEPENIQSERRTRTLEFAKIYHALIYKIIGLSKKKQEQQMMEEKEEFQISLQFLQAIMTHHNAHLIGHIFVNFLLSNKNAFSLNCPQLEKLLFGILQGIKLIYLSFGTKTWYMPTTVLSAFTNRFFNKFSENIKPNVVSALPMMVINLGQDSLSSMPVISKQLVNGQSQFSIKQHQISRSEHLVAIFYFIKDAEDKDLDFYLDLPQITPTNFETSLLFVKSLQLKLKHHEPTEDQKKLWNMIIEQCINEYKIKVDLKWFKHKKGLQIDERECQFMFLRQIKQKWAFDLFQEILNFRQSRKFSSLSDNYSSKDLSVSGDIIPYFKYSIGLDFDLSRIQTWLREDELFILLDKMRNLLDIGFGDIVHLTPEEEVTLNQLHLSLKFYNIKIQEAQGNQIYMLIAHKIIIPWVNSEDAPACFVFQQKFPQFFMLFIIKDYYLAIGDALVELLSNPQSKDQNLIMKLKLFNDVSAQSVPTNSIDSNSEILLKICSVAHGEMTVKVLMLIVNLITQFLEHQPSLKEYVSPSFIVDFLIEPSKFSQFFQEILKLQGDQRNIFFSELFEKLPDIFDQLSLHQINQILKGYVDSSADSDKPERLINILNKVTTEKKSLVLAILKTLIGQRNKQKSLQISDEPKSKNELINDQCTKYWEELEKYIDTHPNENKHEQALISLSLITQSFEETVLKKVKEDYKKLIQYDAKKKALLKKKSILEKKKSESKEQSDKDKEEICEKKEEKIDEKFENIEQQLKNARIWRKVVRNYGTFEDTILFGEDPFEIGGYNEAQIYKECLKFIRQKSIQQKYLKRIIRKLPVLKKCAEEIVTQLNKEATLKNFSVQPQILCKLIMINSRYRSALVEDFIIRNISKVPISIQIYQSYLALDIKRKLQCIPKESVSKMLYQDIGQENLKKIDEVFDSIIYMPIKKFQGIHLQFDNKIQEKQGENQQWKTQSEDESEGEEENETQEPKKEKKQLKEKKQGNNDDVWEDVEDSNANRIIGVDDSSESSLDDQVIDDSELSESMSEDYDDEEENSGEQKAKIAEMFYEENQELLPKYKQFIQLREEINVSFEDNYLNLQSLEKKVKQDPELEKKLFLVVDFLENTFSASEEILIEILNKIPTNLYLLLKNYGLTKERNNEAIQKYRKEKAGMPHFIKQYMSDRDENSDGGHEGYLSQEEYLNEDSDELSQESDSFGDNDLFDGFIFAIGEDGQFAQINAADLMRGQFDESQEEEPESQEIKVVEKLQQDAHEGLTLPQLKQINSQIDSELTGKELGVDEMSKILEIAIIKLFSLRSYQLKHKPVFEFYRQLIFSKQGKVFIDTLFTVLRVDELYSEEERVQLAKKLNRLSLSLSNALSNILQIANDIASEDTKQGKDFCNLLKNQTETFLPAGEDVLIKSKIAMQDKFLTLLIFYSRFSQSNIHQKAKKLITTINSGQSNSYQLKKNKASLLAKHIYKNNNYSSIWNTIQDTFGVSIDMKTKFSSCLAVYGKLLRQDVEKCYNNLLEVVKDQPEGDQKLIIKQQEKKVQQNLRKHFRRIKHYYYWNKRNIIGQLDKQDKKLSGLLKQNELIKLTELMIFYCYFIKQKFNGKIDEKAMKNLLVLPKSIIQTSFMFLWKLQAKIDDWKPLTKVKQYFQSYKLYEHKFTKLEEVCNLILEFLDLPDFSNSKFKQIIIPYFINHPENAHQIPLMFKLPDEEIDGQKLFLTRECSFDMAFYQLTANSFTIEFHNEEGSDHGGMVRELMMGWNGVGVGEEHIFIGKILAFSFRKSVPYGGHFDIAMAIAITQFKVTLQFLDQVEPDVCKSLKYIQEFDPEDLDVRFQITKQEKGIIKHYPLIPNGNETPVTNQNKQNYIELFLANYFKIGREWEMSELCTGFFSSVNRKYAAIFHPTEMIQKIQGQQINDCTFVFNIDTKLMAKTKYAEGYTQSSQMIKWFWEVISNFDQKQMNRFLQFITGAPKVSIYNHSFSFVVEKPYAQDQSRLPVAHTCFNTLELPEYKTKQILEKKLRQAIFQGNDNFGIL